MKRLSNINHKYLLLAVIFTLAFSSTVFADEVIRVTDVKGDALFRELGDYMWSKPEIGQFIFAGDRLRVRFGEAAIEFPQGTLRIIDQGEVELPVQLVDGFAAPWKNDLTLFIGSYEFESNGSEGRLKIQTLFGVIDVGGAARFTIDTNVNGSEIKVLAGNVRIKHRKNRTQSPITLGSGQSLGIGLRGFQLAKGNIGVVPM